MGLESGTEFASSAEFEQWLQANGTSETELWAIIFKKSSNRQSVTFMELLEVALCYGWIDVQTKGLDDLRYGIRFVPRKPGSNWSDTNRTLVRKLIDEGRMTAQGSAVLPSDL